MGNSAPQVVGKNIYARLPNYTGALTEAGLRQNQATALTSAKWDTVIPGQDFSKDVRAFTDVLNQWSISPLKAGKVWELATTSGYTFYFSIVYVADTVDTSIQGDNAKIVFSFDTRYRQGYRRADNGNKITLRA